MANAMRTIRVRLSLGKRLGTHRFQRAGFDHGSMKEVRTLEGFCWRIHLGQQIRLFGSARGALCL
jgi:hypothetical protein